jgi:hypothetical protein
MPDDLVVLQPGTVVDSRWHIIRKLGAGAFGAVYLCSDSHGTTAALKTEPVNTEIAVLSMEVLISDGCEY